MKKCLCLALLCCFRCLPLSALDTRSQIFDSTFRTLRVQCADDFMAPPIIRLNSNDAIEISFDEIGDEVSYLQYRILHCDANWQPSRLLESEYLPGFNLARVDDYAFSTNTFIHYVNYRILIPNEDMTPTRSGNYLLQVFPENEEEEILLQARFSVSDNVAEVGGEITTITDRGANDEWQQLEIDLNLHNYRMQNPYADIIVTIEQNSDPNTLHTLNAPLRLEGQNIFYQHQGELIYPAGNEFRRFETIQVQYPGMGVDSMRYMGKCYHAYLTTDTPRKYAPYAYDQTQNGRFMVRELNATDSDLGADYVMTHFTLKTPKLRDAEVYIDGGITHHLRTDAYRMRYDEFSQCYEIALPLKQGSYNYRYVAVPHSNATELNANAIEGNHYETLNEYLVKVYHRDPGERADYLIGHATLRRNY
jgi:hypothetical protein